MRTQTFMKPGPDVIQPQPQLISGPCNTPQETKKTFPWLGVEGRGSQSKAKVRDAIWGSGSPAKSAEGPIRERGVGGYSLLRCESLRRLPRAWLAVIQGGTGSAGPPLSPLCSPSICLNLTMAHPSTSRVEGWGSGDSPNGRKWAARGGGGWYWKVMRSESETKRGERGGETAQDGEWILERGACWDWMSGAAADELWQTTFGKGQGGGRSHCYFLGGNGLAAPLHSE